MLRSSKESYHIYYTISIFLEKTILYEDNENNNNFYYSELRKVYLLKILCINWF